MSSLKYLFSMVIQIKCVKDEKLSVLKGLEMT